MTSHSIDAVLLAGGRSRRYGSPKSLVLWQGQTLAEHVLASVPERTGRTVLVLRKPGDPVPAKTDVLTHDDPDAPAGPLRGLIAGLRACRATLAWCLACDLPGLVPDLLELLVQEYRAGDAAVVPVWQGRPQPLCALYRVDVVDALIDVSHAGERSLFGALKTLEYRELPAELVRTADPRGCSFHNVNTPADLVSLTASYPEPPPNPERTS